ncbi:hypothetical protein HK105_208959 [Polyrhizophydium stewartii]|uniref:Uncharacterized protein n=1 Tax=Polyrhizophydium stewartii TaxID=2732419 RepID=A0ABR4MWC7_9FUNG
MALVAGGFYMAARGAETSMAGGPAVIPAFVAVLECQSLSSDICLAIATLIVLTIAFRSNALVSLPPVSKMPLLAAVGAFVACLYPLYLDPLKGTEAGTRRQLVVSWCLDAAARALLLWFTSLRLQAICGVSLAIYASAEPSIAFMSDRYKELVVTYPVLDLGTTALDEMVLVQLRTLQRIAVACNINMIDMRAYRRAVACVLVMIALPVASIVLVYLKLDPSAAVYVILLSFRILVTDLFSAALRDSLLEKVRDAATTSTSARASHRI